LGAILQNSEFCEIELSFLVEFEVVRKGAFARLVVLALLGFAATAAFAADSSLDKLPFLKKMQLAKAGDPDAKMAVAEAYETGAETKLDPAKAAKWYREAALTGNVEAQYRLAKLVSKGAPGLSADKPTALKLLQSAAQLGHPASQNLLGQMLQNGDGIAKDEKAAATWYKKSADQNNAAAQNNLGVMYLKGIGVPRDLDKAFSSFDVAAKANDGWALNNLGGMYEMGWGTAKNIDRAKEYYTLAAAAGIALADQNLKRLGGTVTP
jgi:uncharacterized protein